MLRHFLLSTAAFCSFVSLAQTFPGPGGDIEDQQTLNFPINVSGLPTAINNTFGVEQVCLSLTHTYVEDLTLSLVAPDGTIVTLVSNEGGSGDNMQNTCFLWNATTLITSGSAPFTGTYRPEGELADVNNGQNPNGQWRLRINDNANNDEGELLGWAITFSNEPAQSTAFVESELPIVVINTNGEDIPNEPKIDAHMGIIYNGPGAMNHLSDPFNAYNNNIGIELRGSSSASFPQKSYGFETRDINNTELDFDLMGMPEEHDWILYAPYNDKTCMRNILAYDIANKTGHYAPRTQLCEVVLNGDYHGIYVLMEKIKRDNGRVDIANLQPVDIEGDELTGGYIIKVDRHDGPGTYWNSDYQTSNGQNVNFVYVEPKADNIMPQQRDYIQDYVDSFELALYGPNFADPVDGYRRFIDPASFIDYFILNEVSKNVDGYRLSTFLYKDKTSNGGKLNAGPAWDYNLAFWNANYCEGELTTGWAYAFNNVCNDSYSVPFWWGKLLQDPVYTSELKCRWNELRQTVLSLPELYFTIDSVATDIANAQVRHFVQWPLLGEYTWPNPEPIPDDFQGEIAALKSWLQDRIAWMDANLPGTCYLGTDEWTLTDDNLHVYPNPFQTGFQLNFYLPLEQNLEVSLMDMTGNVIRTTTHNLSGGEHTIDLDFSQQQLAGGMYLLRIASGNRTIVRKVTKAD